MRGSAASRVILTARATLHADRVAIVADGQSHSYNDLERASRSVAAALLAGASDLAEARVAYLIPPGFHHVALQWGIWRAGAIAVPLALSHPATELNYVINDADATVVIVDPMFAELARALTTSARVLSSAQLLAHSAESALPEIAPGRRALMPYTSGTTGKPKGVVLTHANLAAQVRSLVEAWDWSRKDRILLVLPLHHVHGIVNVLSCALWSGATCEILPGFDTEATWQRLAAGELTLFMAVPTIYHRLITSWQNAPAEEQRARSAGCRALRLMVSGSAALPVQTLERWRAISGHTLLERYGMTEIGMALSNPLHGERRPGFVGTPLPGVEVRLANESGRPVSTDNTPGEIEVRGPNVFLEYWRRPEETLNAFRDGWFRTGDTAVVEAGYYRILGRTNVDIIKTGGYKVSALEIEELLRAHPAIAECAVVGVPDAEWGERVCVAIELADNAELPLAELQHWARPHLAPYKIPKELQSIEALPRNALGKVIKPEVAKLFMREKEKEKEKERIEDGG